jgi:hypothetical protein
MYSWRTTGLFLATFLVGSAAVLAAYLGGIGTPVRKVNVPARSVVAATPAAKPVVVPVAAQPALAAATTCPSQPLAQARGHGDGRFMLEAALASNAQADPSAFVTVAREAASQGRMRDAEVAWMAACHVAERSAGARSAPVAELKSQMGQHYAALAAREGGDAARDALLQRATALYSESADAFAAALGKNASRTRMAQQRLASLRAPATLQAAARQPAAPHTATMGAARSSAADFPERSRLPTVVLGLVRSDPELAQMESDLQRLRSQAARVTRDPRGMRQRDAWAQAQRDSRCQDRGCLVRWYAQRRQQLLAEF